MTRTSHCQRLLAALISISACSVSPSVIAQKLGADPYSVNWVQNLVEYRCSLEQNIPDFGKVLFSKTPESAITFEIHALTPLYRGKESKLKASPPSWRADLGGFLISLKSKVEKDEKIAAFNTDDSQKAFKALKDGYRLQLALVHGSPPEKVEISIEGLGFGPLLVGFDDCREGAIELQVADNERLDREEKAAKDLALTMAKLEAKAPKTAALTEGDTKTDSIPEQKQPATLQQSLENLPDYYRIPFESGDTEVNDTGASYLDQLLRRWSLAGMPEELILHGHADDADSTGSYINSDLRAQSVVRYLVSKMPELKMRIEAHGDTMNLEDVSSQRVDIQPTDLPSWE